MLFRTTALAVASTLTFACLAHGQDGLEVYDPQGFSGGYAEGSYGPIGSDDMLYPYDQQDPWLHGYIQYMPFYGAYKHFRPYNYKHVMPQSQTAAGWGMSPRMPYSQQFWHRYHARATMSNGASSAQESLLRYPQPNLHGRELETNDDRRWTNRRPEDRDNTEQAPPPEPAPTHNPNGQQYQNGQPQYPNGQPQYPNGQPQFNAPIMNRPYSGVSYRNDNPDYSLQVPNYDQSQVTYPTNYPQPTMSWEDLQEANSQPILIAP